MATSVSSRPQGPALAHKRIVITRAEEDARPLAERLRSLGAEPIVVPAIRIDFTDSPALRAALESLDAYDWIVFTSRNGVEAVFRCTDTLAGPRVAAVGPATATSLERRGVRVDVVPTVHVAEALVDALGTTAGLSILLPQAAIARPTLAEGLAARGANVHPITAYRTVAVPRGQPNLAGVHAVTFASSSAVHGFLEGGPIPTGAKVVCIGPATAATARECGLPVTAQAAEHTEDGLIAALEAAFAVTGEE